MRQQVIETEIMFDSYTQTTLKEGAKGHADYFLRLPSGALALVLLCSACEVAPPETPSPAAPTAEQEAPEPAVEPAPEAPAAAPTEPREAPTHYRRATSPAPTPEPPPTEALATWTSQAGDAIEAELIEIEAENAVFRLVDGQRIRVPLTHLQPADKQRALAHFESPAPIED